MAEICLRKNSSITSGACTQTEKHTRNLQFPVRNCKPTKPSDKVQCHIKEKIYFSSVGK